MPSILQGVASKNDGFSWDEKINVHRNFASTEITWRVGKETKSYTVRIRLPSEHLKKNEIQGLMERQIDTAILLMSRYVYDDVSRFKYNEKEKKLLRTFRNPMEHKREEKVSQVDFLSQSPYKDRVKIDRLKEKIQPTQEKIKIRERQVQEKESDTKKEDTRKLNKAVNRLQRIENTINYGKYFNKHSTRHGIDNQFRFDSIETDNSYEDEESHGQKRKSHTQTPNHQEHRSPSDSPHVSPPPVKKHREEPSPIKPAEPMHTDTLTPINASNDRGLISPRTLPPSKDLKPGDFSNDISVKEHPGARRELFPEEESNTSNVNEIEQLKKKHKEKKQSLKAQLEDLRGDLQQPQDERETRLDDDAAKKKESQELNDKIEKLTQGKKRLKQKVDEMTEEANLLQQEIERLKNTEKEFKNTKGALVNLNLASQKEIEKGRKKQKDLELQIRAMENELQKLTHTIEQHNLLIEQLLKEYRKRIEEMSKRADFSKEVGEKKQVREKEKQGEPDLSSIKATIKKLENVRNNFEQDLQHLAGLIEKHGKKPGETVKQTDIIKQEIENDEELALKDIEELEDNKQFSLEEIEEERRKQEMYLQQLRDRENELQNLRGQLVQQKQVNEEFQEKQRSILAKKSRKNNILKQKIGRLESKTKKLNTTIEELEAKQKTTSQPIKKRSGMKARLKEEKAQKEELLKQQDKEIHDLNKRLEKFEKSNKNLNKNLEEINTKLKQSLEDYSGGTEILLQEKEKLRQINEDLRNENERLIQQQEEGEKEPIEITPEQQEIMNKFIHAQVVYEQNVGTLTNLEAFIKNLYDEVSSIEHPEYYKFIDKLHKDLKKLKESVGI